MRSKGGEAEVEELASGSNGGAGQNRVRVKLIVYVCSMALLLLYRVHGFISVALWLTFCPPLPLVFILGMPPLPESSLLQLGVMVLDTNGKIISVRRPLLHAALLNASHAPVHIY